jgi:hypothetical protein
MVHRIHLRRAVGLVVSLLLASFSLPVLASLKDENLLMPLPQNFKLGWQSPDSHMQEFIVPPETVNDWSRMITIQIFHGLKNVTPDTFAERLAARWNSACNGASAQKVRDGVENGYQIAVWIYICPLNPATHKPETMWLKDIDGADAFYVAQYAYRQEFSKEMVNPAMQFLRQVVVCDTRRADRQCPANFR